MKLALGQINPRVGDTNENLKQMREATERAKNAGAEIVIFPELCTLGYPPRDLLDFSHIISDNLKVVEELSASAFGIAIVGGYVEPNPSGAGKPFFNSCFVLHQGKKIANYRKQLLPYYDVFDEERYFETGESPCQFKLGSKVIALSICEDAWNESTFAHRSYRRSPLEYLNQTQVDLLINISASPFNLGKFHKREALFTKISSRINAPIAFCNQVGANDELIFDGGSFVASNHNIVSRAKVFQPDLVVHDLSLKASNADSGGAVSLPSTEAEWIEEALVLGIRDYVKKSGMKSVLLGLSGGIDSSVVAALAVKALGKEAVFGVALPTRFNSKEGVEDAYTLAQNLKISFQKLPIDSLYESFSSVMTKELRHVPKALTLENIQPRIRMTVLMALSNEGGHLVLNTSNKSEIAAGYATQYGDTAGAIAVLGDLTKAQVYALARHLNKAHEIIPQRVIARAPSAELRENQTDQDSLPPYDELDQLVVLGIEKSHSPSTLGEGKISAKSVDTFKRLNALSEYKRRQLPPALRISAHAFGMGRRIPVASRQPTQ